MPVFLQVEVAQPGQVAEGLRLHEADPVRREVEALQVRRRREEDVRHRRQQVLLQTRMPLSIESRKETGFSNANDAEG